MTPAPAPAPPSGGYTGTSRSSRPPAPDCCRLRPGSALSPAWMLTGLRSLTGRNVNQLINQSINQSTNQSNFLYYLGKTAIQMAIQNQPCRGSQVGVSNTDVSWTVKLSDLSYILVDNPPCNISRRSFAGSTEGGNGRLEY